MKLGDFGFIALLVLSILIVIASFGAAQLERNYYAVGGEIFSVILPILVLRWKAWSIEQSKKQYKRKKLKI